MAVGGGVMVAVGGAAGTVAEAVGVGLALPPPEQAVASNARVPAQARIVSRFTLRTVALSAADHRSGLYHRLGCIQDPSGSVEGMSADGPTQISMRERLQQDYAWTPRQRQVLQLMVDGRTNTEIAEVLGLSLAGAKWHVSEILSKLNAESRDEAAEYWRRHNGLAPRFARIFRGISGGAGLKWVVGAAAGVATVGAVGLVFLIMTMRGDDDASVAPPADAEPTPQLAPGLGPPITAADVTASLPATRDGRRLWPQGTWGGRIVIYAERRVPPVPGEVVGQGPSRYDEQFLAWDPAANTFQLLWTNESGRAEAALNTDGDWALSNLSKNNPLSQWELRLHNMATGEQRTIDVETPAARGTTPSGVMASRVVDGRVLWVNVVIEGGARVEQLRMYTIASGETVILDSSAGIQWPGSTFYAGGINGDTVAYLRGTPGGASNVVLHSLSKGTEREIAPPAGTIWETISPNARFAVAKQDPAPVIGSGPEGPRLVVNLATGETRRFAEGQSYGFGLDFADGYVSWQVPSADNAVNGFFDLNTGLSRILDPSLPVDGQGARVFNGWFVWRERAPGASAANNDRANGILRFMRLP